jgi:hypothetical protein
VGVPSCSFVDVAYSEELPFVDGSAENVAGEWVVERALQRHLVLQAFHLYLALL